MNSSTGHFIHFVALGWHYCVANFQLECILLWCLVTDMSCVCITPALVTPATVCQPELCYLIRLLLWWIIWRPRENTTLLLQLYSDCQVNSLPFIRLASHLVIVRFHKEYKLIYCLQPCIFSRCSYLLNSSSSICSLVHWLCSSITNALYTYFLYYQLFTSYNYKLVIICTLHV